MCLVTREEKRTRSGVARFSFRGAPLTYRLEIPAVRARGPRQFRSHGSSHTHTHTTSRARARGPVRRSRTTGAIYPRASLLAKAFLLRWGEKGPGREMNLVFFDWRWDCVILSPEKSGKKLSGGHCPTMKARGQRTEVLGMARKRSKGEAK